MDFFRLASTSLLSRTRPAMMEVPVVFSFSKLYFHMHDSIYNYTLCYLHTYVAISTSQYLYPQGWPPWSCGASTASPAPSSPSSPTSSSSWGWGSPGASRLPTCRQQWNLKTMEVTLEVVWLMMWPQKRILRLKYFCLLLQLAVLSYSISISYSFTLPGHKVDQVSNTL